MRARVNRCNMKDGNTPHTIPYHPTNTATKIECFEFEQLRLQTLQYRTQFIGKDRLEVWVLMKSSYKKRVNKKSERVGLSLC